MKNMEWKLTENRKKTELTKKRRKKFSCFTFPCLEVQGAREADLSATETEQMLKYFSDSTIHIRLSACRYIYYAPNTFPLGRINSGSFQSSRPSLISKVEKQLVES